MSKNEKTTGIGTVAIAAVVGGLAGALVSLICAPKSGKALRHDIRNKAEGLIEHVEDNTFQRAEALKQRSTELVDKGKKLKEDIQVFIKDLKTKNPGYIDISKSASAESIPSEDESEVNFSESTSAEILEETPVG